MKYIPDYGSDQVRIKLDSEDGIRIKNSFYLERKNEYQGQEIDIEEEEFLFKVGELVGNYYKLSKEIFQTNHDFYFEDGIRIVPKFFVAYRRISILRKIDNLVDKDVYITESEIKSKHGYLPYAVFLDLIQTFPNSTELTKYAHARIAQSLTNYFDGLGDVTPNYEHYLNKRSTMVVTESSLKLRSSQLKLFQNAYEIMQEMLENAKAYSESNWQEKVCEIVRMIYPKYILAKREQIVGTDGRHNKKPDFLLVDSSGFVDILEIKKPNDQRIITRTEYRNNYVADRDLSGAIVQIEKYVYCLNHGGKAIESKLQNTLKSELPGGIKIHVTNPQGMLLMGRSDRLLEEQIFDLEIIKRQHKNILDIMTYDDLMNRIENIIYQLTQ